MIQVILAMIAMVANDAAYEFRGIAQVRGDATLAAILGPIATLAGIAVTGLGAVNVAVNGITPQTIGVLVGILTMDVIDGYVFTRLGRRIKTETGDPEVEALKARIAALEAR